MCSASVLAAVLTASPLFQPVEAPVPSRLEVVRNSPGSAQRLRPRDEFRAAYSQAMRKSARKMKPDLFVIVPELVDLYSDLADTATLSHAEKSRMRRGLKNRLEELRGRVIREELQRQKQRKRESRRAQRVQRVPVDDKLAGGGEANRAAKLIELIQKAISPDTWDVNGGNGTISYFSLLKVLVIRQ